MQENYDHYFEEESLYQAIARFEDMKKSQAIRYFDVCEFEIIIDYYLDQNNYKFAEDAVILGINQHPTSAEIKLKLAQLHISGGKPAKGLKILKELEGVEINSDFYLLKGSALNILGKKDDATQAFDKAIQMTIEGKDEVVYNIAMAYMNTRRYKLAIKYLKLALEINSENYVVLHELATAYERIDDLENSIKYYKLYLDIDPFNDNIWINLGMLYSGLNRISSAIDAYDYAIAIDPHNSSALFSKANTLVNIGDNKEAINTYKEILDFDPANVQALTYIGECYEKLTFYKRSVYYFRKAISIDESYTDAWYGLGIACYQQDNFMESLKYFKKANKLDPENADVWYMMGEVYRKLSMLEKAAESLNRVIELDPTDYEAWLTRAELSCVDNNDLKGAIKILRRAVEYNPEVSSINYQLARYYFKNNQSKIAYLHFEKGLKLNFQEHEDYLEDIPKRSLKQLLLIVKKYNK